MKKSLSFGVLVMAMLALCINLSSCSDDEDGGTDGSFLEYDAGDYAVGTWTQSSGKLSINYDNEKTFELYPQQGVIFVPISYNISKLTDKDMALKATVLGFEGTQTYKRQ